MPDDSNPCPFCELVMQASHPRVISENIHAFVIRDGFPVADGHTLIIPKRHTGSFFDLTNSERQSIFELLDQAKAELDKEFHPPAYNVGINDGVEAGQTIPHCHVHLIPRYCEQGKDPRGGVRWVVPEKAAYWNNK